MAPEVEYGQNLESDQRSADFYSFGKLIWATLSKRRALPREKHCEEYENSLEYIFSDRRYRTVDALIKRLAEGEPSSRESDWSRIIEEMDFAQRDILSGDSRPASAGLDADSILSRARRLAVCGPVSVVQEEFAERARKSARERMLLTMLHEGLAQPLRPIVAELNQHLSNFANFNISYGQSSWRDNLETSKILDPLVRKAGGPNTLVGTLCSRFSLICTRYLRPQQSAELFVGGVYENEEAWLLMAVFLRRGDPPNVEYALLDGAGFTRIEGPLSLHRPSTERKMGQFIEGAALASGKFMSKSMALMENGDCHLFDPQGWITAIE